MFSLHLKKKTSTQKNTQMTFLFLGMQQKWVKKSFKIFHFRSPRVHHSTATVATGPNFFASHTAVGQSSGSFSLQNLWMKQPGNFPKDESLKQHQPATFWGLLPAPQKKTKGQSRFDSLRFFVKVFLRPKSSKKSLSGLAALNKLGHPTVA